MKNEKVGELLLVTGAMIERLLDELRQEIEEGEELRGLELRKRRKRPVEGDGWVIWIQKRGARVWVSDSIISAAQLEIQIALMLAVMHAFGIEVAQIPGSATFGPELQI